MWKRAPFSESRGIIPYFAFLVGFEVQFLLMQFYWWMT